MKNKIYLTVGVIGIMIFLSCVGKKQAKDETIDQMKFLQAGTEISSVAQATLIQNLTKAIDQGGTHFAVEFCNLKAMVLVDSINKLNNCVLSRVSDRNRNPENYLRTEDKLIWEAYKNSNVDFVPGDTVVKLAEKSIFYRPIKIGMPACLKCHGKASEDINDKTLAKINSLYPMDLAKNYKSGELRGLWKVEFFNSTN